MNYDNDDNLSNTDDVAYNKNDRTNPYINKPPHLNIDSSDEDDDSSSMSSE